LLIAVGVAEGRDWPAADELLDANRLTGLRRQNQLPEDAAAPGDYFVFKIGY